MLTDSAAPKCHECPFAVNGRSPHTPVMGTTPSTVSGVLVGEGPGPFDAKEGRPFCGTTGRALDVALNQASLNKSTLAVLNAVACLAPPGRTDAQMRKAVKCCAPLFQKQYEPIKTKPTFAMGKWAATSVEAVRHGTFEPRAVKLARGFLRDDNTLIISWHPTYAFFRNAWERANFEVDLHRFSRMVHGTLRLNEPRLYLDDAEALKEITAQDWAAVDIETGPSRTDMPWTGKDPVRAVIRCVGLGNEKDAVSVNATNLRSGRLADGVALFLKNAAKVKVLQNGWHFDLPILARYGFEVK